MQINQSRPRHDVHMERLLVLGWKNAHSDRQNYVPKHVQSRNAGDTQLGLWSSARARTLPATPLSAVELRLKKSSRPFMRERSLKRSKATLP